MLHVYLKRRSEDAKALANLLSCLSYFQGAFQAWIKPDGNAAEAGDGKWRGIPMPGGHFGPVKDLSWAPSGDYLLTASCDQVKFSLFC